MMQCLCTRVTNVRPQGGSCELHPANWVEYYVHCFMMLVGSSIWAFVIGSGCGIIATLNPERIEYHQTMDQVNYFARKQQLPTHLTTRLRSFFHSTQSMLHSKRYGDLLDKMSGSLRADVCSHVARATLSRVPYFHEGDVESDFLPSVALALKPRVYCPRELVCTDELIVVERGVAVRIGKIFLKGMCLGEDMIVAREAFRDQTPAISLSFLQVSVLERPALDEVLDVFPQARETVRKAAFRIALRRAFVLAANVLREADGQSQRFAARGGQSSSSRTASSARSCDATVGGVLMAVAPLQKVLAREESSQLRRLDDLYNGVAQKRLRDSSVVRSEERMLLIERRTDAIVRGQRDLQEQMDRLACNLIKEVRTMLASTLDTRASAAQGKEVSSGAERDTFGSQLDVASRQANFTTQTSTGQPLRRRLNTPSKQVRGEGAAGKTSPSKSVAPSMRRVVNATAAVASNGAPAEVTVSARETVNEVAQGSPVRVGRVVGTQDKDSSMLEA